MSEIGSENSNLLASSSELNSELENEPEQIERPTPRGQNRIYSQIAQHENIANALRAMIEEHKDYK